MNQQRYKKLLLAKDLLQQASEIVSDVQSAEQDAYDNMPESLANDDVQQNAEELSNAAENIDYAFAIVEDICNTYDLQAQERKKQKEDRKARLEKAKEIAERAKKLLEEIDKEKQRRAQEQI